MKHTLLLIAPAVLALSACSGSGTAGAVHSADSTASDANLSGDWEILNVVASDSSYARPAEIAPGVRQYFSFDSLGNFGISTNCNLLGGNYSVNGNELKLFNVTYTEIACDDMQVETLIKKILPAIESVRFENDSVARLLTPNPAAYILLLKARGNGDSAKERRTEP